MTYRIISDHEVTLQMHIDVQGKALQKSMNEVIELRQQLAEAQAQCKKLEQELDAFDKSENSFMRKAIELEAMVEASRKQVPMAWELFFDNGNSNGFTSDKGEAAEFGENKRPLYTAPVVAPDVLKDAERYRWLRDEAFNGFIVENMSVYPRTGLSAEIDAAMGGAA